MPKPTRDELKAAMRIMAGHMVDQTFGAMLEAVATAARALAGAISGGDRAQARAQVEALFDAISERFTETRDALLGEFRDPPAGPPAELADADRITGPGEPA